MTLNDYLSGPEEMRRRELVWGVMHEPPSPYVPHQRLIVRISALLDTHVRERDLPRSARRAGWPSCARLSGPRSATTRLRRQVRDPTTPR